MHFNVRFSGRKTFEVGIRIVEETEDEGGVTQILAAELGDDTGFQLGLTVNGVRPTRGQWIRNLEGVMVSPRFPFEGSRNPLFKWEPRAEGLWLSEESAIVVGVADSVSMWNYETGQSHNSTCLPSPLPRRQWQTLQTTTVLPHEAPT